MDELGGQKNTKILVTSYVGNKNFFLVMTNVCTSMPVGQMGDLGAVIFQKILDQGL